MFPVLAMVNMVGCDCYVSKLCICSNINVWSKWSSSNLRTRIGHQPGFYLVHINLSKQGNMARANLCFISLIKLAVCCQNGRLLKRKMRDFLKVHEAHEKYISGKLFQGSYDVPGYREKQTGTLTMWLLILGFFNRKIFLFLLMDTIKMAFLLRDAQSWRGRVGFKCYKQGRKCHLFFFTSTVSLVTRGRAQSSSQKAPLWPVFSQYSVLGPTSWLHHWLEGFSIIRSNFLVLTLSMLS